MRIASRPISTLILVAATFSLGACEQLGIKFSTPGGGGAADYDGAECDEVRYTEAEAASGKGEHKKDDSTRAQALLVTCPETTITVMQNGYPTAKTRYRRLEPLEPKEIHLAFDDRKIDHVKAALFVIRSVASDRFGRSASRTHARKDSEVRVPDDETSVDEMISGLASMYAALIDESELAKQLGALKLASAAQQAFVASYHTAKQVNAQRAQTLAAGKRKILVELPLGVLSARRQYFATHKEAYAKLDAIEAQAEAARAGGAGSDAMRLASALTKLRNEYAAACGTEECTYDPFYVETTRELALLYTGTRQAMLAAAETSLLTRKEANTRLRTRRRPAAWTPS
jgi:hypothetical protein